MRKELQAFLVFCFVILSCSEYEIPVDESPIIQETVTYNDDIKSIMDDNCISCHGTVNPSANLSLTNYSLVKNSTENGNLIARMNNITNPMPPNGILSEATRALVDEWKGDGYLED